MAYMPSRQHIKQASTLYDDRNMMINQPNVIKATTSKKKKKKKKKKKSGRICMQPLQRVRDL